MKWIIILIGMIIWGYINGFFSSDKTTNPWITDDERETKIKQKAIIASWSGVFMFCIINLLNKWLGVGTSNTSPYLPDPVKRKCRGTSFTYVIHYVWTILRILPTKAKRLIFIS